MDMQDWIERMVERWRKLGQLEAPGGFSVEPGDRLIDDGPDYGLRAEPTARDADIDGFWAAQGGVDRWV